jgi:hypothetical protein
MTKNEAKRIVCTSFVVHMDNGSSNEFLYYDDDGTAYSDEDAKRMVDAFNELIAELWKRGGNTTQRKPLGLPNDS